MRLRRAAVIALLTGATSSVLISGTFPSTAIGAQSVPDPTTSTLRELAAHTGPCIGTAIDMAALNSDATYRAAVDDQFSSVTPENVMKWEVVEAQRGQFGYSAADQLVDFARAQHQVVRGHTLVWHSQLPAWLTSGTWTPHQLRDILREPIFAEARHFRGRIWARDVVNEAFNEDGSLRGTLWLRALGPDYIADAFRWAHQADPKARLFYNDFTIEGINPKSDAVYALVRGLAAKGVPIQGVGMQAHLGTQYDFPAGVLANLRRFAKLGIDTAMTEADVRNILPIDATKVQAQAAGYSLLLKSCLLGAAASRSRCGASPTSTSGSLASSPVRAPQPSTTRTSRSSSPTRPCASTSPSRPECAPGPDPGRRSAARAAGANAPARDPCLGQRRRHPRPGFGRRGFMGPRWCRSNDRPCGES